MDTANSLYVFQSKVKQNVQNCKFNDPEVYEMVRRLYEDENQTLDYITANVIISRTKLKTMIKGFKKRKHRNHVCRFTLHCLLYEHGLTNKQAAQALGIHHSSICRILRRPVSDFRTKYDRWKREHTKWRESLRKG